MVSPKATLKSHLTLPLAVEGEILGCLSLSSDRPNAFDAQDLQFLSVIGYQMAASSKHFQRFSSIKNMAIYDTLTGLYNRRYFEERLEAEARKIFLRGHSPFIGNGGHRPVLRKSMIPSGIPMGIRSFVKFLPCWSSVRKKDMVAPLRR